MWIFAECNAFGTVDGMPWGWQHCTYCDMMPPQMTTAAVINSAHIPIGTEIGTWAEIKDLYR